MLAMYTAPLESLASIAQWRFKKTLFFRLRTFKKLVQQPDQEPPFPHQCICIEAPSTASTARRQWPHWGTLDQLNSSSVHCPAQLTVRRLCQAAEERTWSTFELVADTALSHCWNFTTACFLLVIYVQLPALTTTLTLIPAAGGVKCPPVYFCLCSSKTARDTAMRFSDIVQDSEGYLSPYKVLSNLYRKCRTWAFDWHQDRWPWMTLNCCKVKFCRNFARFVDFGRQPRLNEWR